jgi:hypothetical protein
MRITWKEITTFWAVAVLVGVLCLVAVDVLSGFYAPAQCAGRLLTPTASRQPCSLTATAQVDRDTVIAATSTTPSIKSRGGAGRARAKGNAARAVFSAIANRNA